MAKYSIKLALPALLAGLLMAAPAAAQQSVVTSPSNANSGNSSSTIASSSAFQLIWSSQANPGSGGASGHRQGCLVLNNATHQQWVYFQGPGMAAPTGPTFAAIKALSVPLQPAAGALQQGGYVNCSTASGGALQDAVWIAGTATDTFYANRQ